MRDVAIIIVSVIITIILEWLVFFVAGIRDKRLWLSIPINVVTNLSFNIFVTYVLKKMPQTDILFWLSIVGLEIAIVFIEAFLYQLIKKDRKNLLYSLIANTISAILGTLILNLIFYFVK